MRVARNRRNERSGRARRMSRHGVSLFSPRIGAQHGAPMSLLQSSASNDVLDLFSPPAARCHYVKAIRRRSKAPPPRFPARGAVQTPGLAQIDVGLRAARSAAPMPRGARGGPRTRVEIRRAPGGDEPRIRVDVPRVPDDGRVDSAVHVRGAALDVAGSHDDGLLLPSPRSGRRPRRVAPEHAVDELDRRRRAGDLHAAADVVGTGRARAVGDLARRIVRPRDRHRFSDAPSRRVHTSSQA